MTKYDPPTSPVCFLSEPIDRTAGRDPGGTWLARELSDHGMVVYRPAGAWSGGNHHPAAVEGINRAVLATADVLVADLRGDFRTYGVPMEIEAHTARDRIAVVLWPAAIPRSVSLQANQHVVWAETANEAAALAADYGHIAWKQRTDAAKWCEQYGQPRVPELRLRTALGAARPSRAYDDDAGIDLITAVDTEIPPGGFVDVPTTVIGVQPPGDSWLMITGRSSTLRKHGLLVPLAVIDSGWRGPLFAGVWNLGAETVKVKAGDRLAQVIAIHNRTADLWITTGPEVPLDEHERGLNGFGSTGRGSIPQALELPEGTDAATTPVSWPSSTAVHTQEWGGMPYDPAPLAELPTNPLTPVVDTERTVG